MPALLLGVALLMTLTIDVMDVGGQAIIMPLIMTLVMDAGGQDRRS